MALDPRGRPGGTRRGDLVLTMSDDTRRYELRLRGHLDGRWSSWFDGLAITHEADGTTTLRGGVRDQAELHGLLARVRDLGVPLISLTTVDEPPDQA